MESNKKINLGESHEFQEYIRVGYEDFFTQISLTPKKITVKISGEKQETRPYPHCALMSQPSTIKISDRTINVHDLTFECAHHSQIPSSLNGHSYFEETYSCDYVIALSSHITQPTYKGFVFNSETLRNWIGTTIKQTQIMNDYQQGINIFKDVEKLTELSIRLHGVAGIAISYNPIYFQSGDTKEAGIKFPPTFTVFFNDIKNTEETKIEIDRAYNFLSFFIGTNFNIETIELLLIDNLQKGFLYKAPYSSAATNLMHNMFFPLGHNLASHQFGYETLPEIVFVNYFNQSNSDFQNWERYLKYRSMNSSEEKFLGFFRLLEARCKEQQHYVGDNISNKIIRIIKRFIKSEGLSISKLNGYFSGIKRLDTFKLNTEKCISRFYKSLPITLTDAWALACNDIEGICRLRNDITHANPYTISSYDLDKRTKFIEVLLVISMSLKIGVTMESLVEAIPKLPGYAILIKWDSMRQWG